VLFTLATFGAVLLNGGGAYVNYVLWSDGLVSHDLYQTLIDLGGGAAALVVLLCVGATAGTYALGLDTARPRRPIVRTALLAFSFFLFLSGYFVGRAQVAPDNYPILGLVLLADVVMTAAWLWAEKTAGRLAIALAGKALGNAPATIVYWWARIGLMLCPSNRKAENILAQALARLGRWRGAEHFLKQAYDDGERDADLCKALGQVAESAGDLTTAADYFEQAYRLSPSTALFRKLVALWESTDQKRKALDALQRLPDDERRHWIDQIRELTFEVGTVDEMRAICRELEHDGPPFTRAREAYQLLLAQHPHDVATLEALLELAHRTNEQEEEKRILQRLIALRPDQPDYRRRLIEIYRWQGRTDEVLAQLDLLVDRGEATRAERLEAAHEHFALAEYARVEKIVTGSQELRSSKEAAWLLASSYFERGLVDEAYREVERAKHLSGEDSPDVRSRLTSLETRIEEHQLQKELNELAARVEREPDNLDLRFRYYDRLTAMGGADRVVVGLEELLTKQPDLLDRILDELATLIERHQHNFRLMSYLSDLYQRQRQWDKVFELHKEMAADAPPGTDLLFDGAQKILHENPEHLPSLLYMAQHEAQAGHRGEALNYLERYYKGGGQKDAKLLALEFDLVRQLGQEERAAAVGAELLKVDPANKELLMTLAAMAARQGRYSDAVALATRALGVDPADPRVRQLLKEYEQKQALARIDELRAQITGVSDNDAPLHLELGDLLHDFGRLNEAIVEYQKAAHGESCHNLACAKLGYVLAFKGLFAEAEEMLNEVTLNVEQPAEEAAKLKALLFRSAEIMEKESEFTRALNVYKRIFRVDAGYRDVVTKIEKLQHLARK
jgi:tetratricopeptide (TPR) repeat protein